MNHKQIRVLLCSYFILLASLSWGSEKKVFGLTIPATGAVSFSIHQLWDGKYIFVHSGTIEIELASQASELSADEIRQNYAAMMPTAIVNAQASINEIISGLPTSPEGWIAGKVWWSIEARQKVNGGGYLAQYVTDYSGHPENVGNRSFSVTTSDFIILPNPPKAINSSWDHWKRTWHTIYIEDFKELGKPNDCIGNPISISTGNKFQQEVILNRPLPLTLSYNSLDQQWRHSYAYALETSDSTATLIRPDGKGLGFTEANGAWTANDGDVFYTLSAFDNGSGSVWKVTTQSGSEELYDDQGRILSITSLKGQSLHFTHTGTTTEVSDEFGNVLLLTQDTNEHLTAVALNGVSQATLTYDSGERLISRTDAQNNTVQYHYEDTRFHNHLTGITGADGQRFATWAYDTEGRGILSEHAGQETAQLAFNADGFTTVTNSLGKQTTYHYEEIEGLKRPVQIEGHASDNCVAANQAYTYNANGLVETQTDWSGNITRFEYNDRGLVTRKTVAEGTAQERVTEQVWHETLPLLLQTQSAGRITQYQYDAESRLISTEESSVPSP